MAEFVSSFGGVWKLTNANFKRYLRAKAGGLDVSLDDYGKQIVHSMTDITDMTAEDARDKYEYLYGKMPERY